MSPACRSGSTPTTCLRGIHRSCAADASRLAAVGSGPRRPHEGAAMRIAQIAPPWLRIPPCAYGGVENVVATLTDGLVERGHDVTLFACRGSRTSARLAAYE